MCVCLHLCVQGTVQGTVPSNSHQLPAPHLIYSLPPSILKRYSGIQSNAVLVAPACSSAPPPVLS